MMKRYCLVLLGIIINLAVYGQHRTDEKSLLWRISGKGMNKPSYLFGTMHLICQDDYFWTDSMDACLHGADEVCFEIDMSDPRLQIQATAAMMNANGKKLKDYFNDSEYKIMENFFHDSLNLDIELLSNMKPIALESIMLNTVAACKTHVMYEEQIAAEAKKENKHISGLEELQEQIDVLNKIPVDTVVKELVSMTQPDTADRKEYQRMVTAYKNQDLYTLYELMKKSKSAGLDMGSFVDDRNKKWIERMIDKMDQGSVFFAVGSGHLPGEKGVINLLRKKGYKVEPVK
jgi:uncharacterized protein YbaP (TraB family)